MLAQQVIGAFRAPLRGDLIEPGDTHYDEARKLHPPGSNQIRI